MPITDWPHEDRPREKLLLKGERVLTDAELIAIFLKTGTHGKTALDLAKELLTEFGTLKQLLRASPVAIIKKRGIGRAKYASLKAAIELGRRYLQVELPQGALLNNSFITQQFFRERLGDYPNEVLACLFTDQHFRLLAFEELFHGTVNEASIYPRDIVKRALELNAVHLILAHNHPSGSSLPSTADKEVTKLIQQALALVDIDVIDHIIVSQQTSFSFADAGLLISK